MFEQLIPISYCGPLLCMTGSKPGSLVSSIDLNDLNFKVEISQFKEAFNVKLSGLTLGNLVYMVYSYESINVISDNGLFMRFDGQQKLLLNLATDNKDEFHFQIAWWDEERRLTGQQILDLLTPG